MLAFHNNQQLKDDLLAQLQAHYDADEIIKGKYWENGKGCAVGCCIHSNSYKQMSDKFGIPLELCYLLDKIFEGLPNNLSKDFPLQFIKSIPVGADLSKVWNKFAIWLLIDPYHGVTRFSSNTSITKVAQLHQKIIDGSQVSLEEWENAYAAAYAAADAAHAAAHAAADAAHAAAHAVAYAARADAADAYQQQASKLLELLISA